MKLDNDVLNVLIESRIEGMSLFLPPKQLERKLYESVNKALVALGGKWNKKAKAHLFDHNPTDDIEAALQTGEVIDPKKVFQFFETPKELTAAMIRLAKITEGDIVLEPSAGKGAIADEISRVGAKVFCVELNPKCIEILKGKGYETLEGDFLTCLPISPTGVFKKIIMNPPFSMQQDVDHILYAFNNLLDNGGILVSVVSESPFFRENRKSVEFRQWLENNNAAVFPNPPDTFKASGTCVNTRLIKIVKD